jgi:hypothetical protein
MARPPNLERLLLKAARDAYFLAPSQVTFQSVPPSSSLLARVPAGRAALRAREFQRPPLAFKPTKAADLLSHPGLIQDRVPAEDGEDVDDAVSDSDREGDATTGGSSSGSGLGPKPTYAGAGGYF